MLKFLIETFFNVCPWFAGVEVFIKGFKVFVDEGHDGVGIEQGVIQAGTEIFHGLDNVGVVEVFRGRIGDDRLSVYFLVKDFQVVVFNVVNMLRAQVVEQVLVQGIEVRNRFV